MKLIRKLLYLTLEILIPFLSLTAFFGGLALVANFYSPPVELLENSPFEDYTLPGLSLSLIVGGSALFAAILLFRKSKYAVLLSATAGVIIMFFEFVEVLVIGSPPGAAQFMQVFYFGLGTLVMVASLGIWFLDLRANQPC